MEAAKKSAVVLKRIVNHKYFYPTCSLLVFLYLLYLAYTVRFRNIEFPSETVFDEVYFATFGLRYVRREFFFDIHPPMAKLTIGLVQKMTNFNTTNPPNYDVIGTKYPDKAYIYVRYMMAALAVFTAMLCFLTVRRLGVTLAGAALACWLIIYDGLFQVMATKILTDSFLWFFQALSIYLAILFWQHEDETRPKIAQAIKSKPSQEHFIILSQFKDIKWWLLCLATGTSLGHTACVKWTGVGVIGAVGLCQMWRTFRFLIPKYQNNEIKQKEQGEDVLPVSVEHTEKLKPSPLQIVNPHFEKQTNFIGDLVRMYNRFVTNQKVKAFVHPIIQSIKENKALIVQGLVGGIAIIIMTTVFYVLYWVIHFHVLIYFGDGIDFMSVDFKKSMIDKQHLEREIVPMNVFSKIIEMHKTMFVLNSGITSPHPYGSEWTSWPFVDRGVLFWGRSTNEGLKYIILQGNPIIVYIATTIIVVFTLIGMRRIYSDTNVKDVDTKSSPTTTISTRDLLMSGGWMVLGYSLNMFPYSRIVRTCYVYHFVPAYYWNIMLIPITIEYLTAGRSSVWRYAVYGIMAYVALSYWDYYNQLYYGDAMTSSEFAEKKWLTSWP